MRHPGHKPLTRVQMSHALLLGLFLPLGALDTRTEMGRRMLRYRPPGASSALAQSPHRAASPHCGGQGCPSAMGAGSPAQQRTTHDPLLFPQLRRGGLLKRRKALLQGRSQAQQLQLAQMPAAELWCSSSSWAYISRHLGSGPSQREDQACLDLPAKDRLDAASPPRLPAPVTFW